MGTGAGCFYGDSNFTVRHLDNSGLKYVQALNPFQLVAVPVAMAQLKVLPYTIVYQPPGDASKGTFSTSASFGVSMTVDNKSTTNTTTTIDNSGSISGSAGISVDQKTDDGAASFGFTLSGAQKWDHSTKTGVGSSNSTTVGTGTNFQTLFSMTVGDSTLIPGAAGSYASEPFWDDTFVLLVHPQLSLWTIAGQPVVSLLGASGSSTAPDFIAPTVRDLAACWLQVDPYANGIPTGSGTEVLTKDECHELLKLDPFWGVGQSIPAWTGGSLQDPRALYAGETDYGIDPACAQANPPCASDENPKMQQVMTRTSSLATGGSTSFSVSVTDLVGSSFGAGLSLKIFGFGGDFKLDGGESTSTGMDMSLTLTESVTATAQTSTEIDGVFDDHHGTKGDGAFLAYRPHVVVYVDQMLGGFMYQDKTAPGPPVPPAQLVPESLKVVLQAMPRAAWQHKTVQVRPVPRSK
jgi:hypothetical protein